MHREEVYFVIRAENRSDLAENSVQFRLLGRCVSITFWKLREKPLQSELNSNWSWTSTDVYMFSMFRFYCYFRLFNRNSFGTVTKRNQLSRLENTRIAQLYSMPRIMSPHWGFKDSEENKAALQGDITSQNNHDGNLSMVSAGIPICGSPHSIYGCGKRPQGHSIVLNDIPSYSSTHSDTRPNGESVESWSRLFCLCWHKAIISISWASYLRGQNKDTGMMGLASVWAMARRGP